jgi:hypothetical protein
LLFLFVFSFVSHFPRRSFFSRLFKPINVKSITAMPHPREKLQESGNGFHPMDWTISGKDTDLSFVNENAEDSILRNPESDSIETDERDLQKLKQEEPRILTVRGMQTMSSRPKYRIRIERSKLCKK